MIVPFLMEPSFPISLTSTTCKFSSVPSTLTYGTLGSIGDWSSLRFPFLQMFRLSSVLGTRLGCPPVLGFKLVFRSELGFRFGVWQELGFHQMLGF